MISKLARLMGRGCRVTILPNTSCLQKRLSMPSVHHATLNSTNPNVNNIHSIDYSMFDGNSMQCMAFSTKTRRRRRRGGGMTVYNPMEGEEEAQDSESSSSSAGRPVALSYRQFLVVSKSLLDRVESAVTKLKDCNDGLEITRYPPVSTAGSTSDSEEDEDDNPRYQEHGGQLSIQVEPSGDLYWGGGTYWLTILPDDSVSEGSGGDREPTSAGVVKMQSPLSGSFTYVYDAASGEWVGSEDGHSLLGMLTRDWIRQCRGVPDF